MRNLIIMLSGALVLASCNDSGKSGSEIVEMITIRYECEGGEQITVDYDNSDPDKSIAYVQLSPENPEKIKLTIAISASGARYTDGKLVWWTKGKTAFLTEEGSPEVPLYDNCIEFEETTSLQNRS